MRSTIPATLALLLTLHPALAAQTMRAPAVRDAAAAPVVNTKDGVAAHGYDVVLYHTAQAATPGLPEFTARHEGATYRFASAESRDLFVKAPARYVPAYGGYCAMGVAVGRKFDIDPTAFRIVNGTLYLNKDAKTQAAWLKDVPGHIAKADANWPTVARS